ncbi:unnamed protein product [Lampetra fluviatilis]
MAANYEESDAGKFIPASRRADGTWRKPRRVKEGYVPPEEVPVYENKYVKFYKSKPSLPPGLSVAAADELKQKSQQEGDQSSGAALSKTAKKNLRRKEKRKQQQEPHEGGGGHDEDDVAHDSGGGDDDTAALSEALHRSSIAERDAGDPGEERKAGAPASTEEPHAAGRLGFGETNQQSEEEIETDRGTGAEDPVRGVAPAQQGTAGKAGPEIRVGTGAGVAGVTLPGEKKVRIRCLWRVAFVFFFFYFISPLSATVLPLSSCRSSRRRVSTGRGPVTCSVDSPGHVRLLE